MLCLILITNIGSFTKKSTNQPPASGLRNIPLAGSIINLSNLITMEITKAICAITTEVGSIAKTKKNEQQGFRFRGVDDLMNTLHPLFAKYAVFAVPEVLESTREERVTAKGTALISAILRVKYHFTAMDGSEICATVIGEGMDTADKASNKALSVAFKYACFQVFCIATEEVAASDPDNYTPDGSIAAHRVIMNRLYGCKSKDELRQIANDFGGTIQKDEQLLILYKAIKKKFFQEVKS